MHMGNKNKQKITLYINFKVIITKIINFQLYDSL